MDPVEPKVVEGTTLFVYAKNQPPYRPLPVLVDDEGTVTSEWELTAEELAVLLDGGRIRLTMLFNVRPCECSNGNRPLTPVRLEVVDVG